MKKFSVTFLIWVTVLIVFNELSTFRYILIETIYPISGALDLIITRAWFVLISGFVLHLAAGGTLKILIKSTTIAGLLGLVFSLLGVYLDLLSGSPIFTYENSHPDRVDFLLMYGPLLSPFIFIPMGIYLVSTIQKYRQNVVVK